MAYREVGRMEYEEIVRRWQAGESQRAIARALGLARHTVAAYIRYGAAIATSCITGAGMRWWR